MDRSPLPIACQYDDFAFLPSILLKINSLLLDLFAAHLPVLPWGDLFPNPPFYTDRDQYKDDHPVFNLSVIAVIKMTITPDDLAALYLPKNVRAPTWYNVSMSFNNGYIDQAWDVRLPPLHILPCLPLV